MLERAFKLYDGEDYYSASIELNKVVEGESGDSEPNKQKAEFWMGKALYNMKFYSASLSYFDRIVQKGPSHAYYNATLKWLASLSRQLPDSTGILEKIGKYNRAELDQPALEKVRDELYFLLGKFYYQKGKLQGGGRAVPGRPGRTASSTSRPSCSRARRTSASTRPSRPSRRSRRSCGPRRRARIPRIQPYEDIANLSLARTFYSTGQFDLAVKYFDRVSQDAYDWANSLFESSWANFMLKDKGYSKALGNIHTIQAPYFDEYIKPESVAEGMTVKATIYFYNCLYDRAEEAIGDFNAIYPDVFQELKKLITGTQDNGDLYEMAVKIRKQTSGLPEQVERAARGVLGDLTLGRRFDYVERARQRAQALRQGRRLLEVDQHRAERLRRPDAAALAGGQRGGRSGPPPHQAPHRGAVAAHQARHQDRVRNPGRPEGRARGRGQAGAAGHPRPAACTAPTRSAPTTST